MSAALAACNLRQMCSNPRAMIRGAPPYAMPSMAVDLRAGNRLELPWLSGKVVQLGLAHDVPTPVNRVIYAGLKPYINGIPDNSSRSTQRT